MVEMVWAGDNRGSGGWWRAGEQRAGKKKVCISTQHMQFFQQHLWCVTIYVLLYALQLVLICKLVQGFLSSALFHLRNFARFVLYPIAPLFSKSVQRNASGVCIRTHGVNVAGVDTIFVIKSHSTSLPATIYKSTYLCKGVRDLFCAIPSYLV